MAKSKSDQYELLQLLAKHLRMRRETILNIWRIQCAEHPDLTSKMSFSREEFNDQVPMLLNVLEDRLSRKAQPFNPVEIAHEHGLHRWHVGYSLSELIIELEILFELLLTEIQSFVQSQSLDKDSLPLIYNQLFKLSAEAIRGSVSYYDRLRQTSAIEQANSLQQALDQLQQLGKKRNEHLRQNSHDLKSSFSALRVATQLLEIPSKDDDRKELMEILNRNISSIGEMLLQLTDFAKIEAGQEVLAIKKFDASRLIRDAVSLARPIATQQDLFLTDEGPTHLEIVSDPIQVQRIIQNLLHNALKYTVSGGIYVSWGQENETRWILSIQDTGPGFPLDSPAALLADQLKPLSRSNSSLNKEPSEEQPAIETLKNLVPPLIKESEGLGLFIVKKICELMKATMDIESTPDNGTLVRIRFLSQQPPNKPGKSDK